jgi:hypothetical protein
MDGIAHRATIYNALLDHNMHAPTRDLDQSDALGPSGSFTRTKRYLGTPASSSTSDLLASSIGRSCIHGFIPVSAASCSISRISAGDPQHDPVSLTRFIKSAFRGAGKLPSSGLPTWQKVPSCLSRAT